MNTCKTAACFLVTVSFLCWSLSNGRPMLCSSYFRIWLRYKVSTWWCVLLNLFDINLFLYSALLINLGIHYRRHKNTCSLLPLLCLFQFTVIYCLSFTSILILISRLHAAFQVVWAIQTEMSNSSFISPCVLHVSPVAGKKISFF
jgi:hypothetical protein